MIYEQHMIEPGGQLLLRNYGIGAFEESYILLPTPFPKKIWSSWKSRQNYSH